MYVVPWSDPDSLAALFLFPRASALLIWDGGMWVHCELRLAGSNTSPVAPSARRSSATLAS